MASSVSLNSAVSLPQTQQASVNQANGSFEKAMEGDKAMGGPEGAGRGGITGDVFGDQAKSIPIGDDLFE